MILNLIVIGLILLIISILDLKFKAIPSILLTGLLFVVIILYPSGLYFGVLGLIMSILLYESDFFDGIADIKVMVIISFMIISLSWMIIFIFSVLFLGNIIKIAYKGEKFMPLIYIFFFIYIIMSCFGGIV